MGRYLVESNDFSIEHGGQASQGVIGEHKGKEKIYLHVLQIPDAGVSRLAPRVDEHGNSQHDRLVVPNVDEWWFAVEGEAAWPGVYRPRLTSHCTDVATRPRPAALSDEDVERLRKAGWKGV